MMSCGLASDDDFATSDIGTGVTVNSKGGRHWHVSNGSLQKKSSFTTVACASDSIIHLPGKASNNRYINIIGSQMG